MNENGVLLIDLSSTRWRASDLGHVAGRAGPGPH